MKIVLSFKFIKSNGHRSPKKNLRKPYRTNKNGENTMNFIKKSNKKIKEGLLTKCTSRQNGCINT